MERRQICPLSISLRLDSGTKAIISETEKNAVTIVVALFHIAAVNLVSHGT